MAEEQDQSISDGEELNFAFNRMMRSLEPNEPNRLRFLWESTNDEVPASFQEDWQQLLEERRGNIGVLDGYMFVTNTLMKEEGFHKIPEPDGNEKETRTIRRSYFSHLSGSTGDYCCALILSSPHGDQQILIQSYIPQSYRRCFPSDESAPSVNIERASRYWISNAYGGSLRMNVLDMYRNLPELAVLLKDRLVFKLKTYIGRGLNPPVIFGIESLPMEVLERLVSSFADPADIIRFARCSKRISRATYYDAIWKKMALKRFPVLRTLSDNDIRENHGSWRQVFLAEYKADLQQRRIEKRRQAQMRSFQRYPWAPQDQPPAPLPFPIGFLPPPPLAPLGLGVGPNAPIHPGNPFAVPHQLIGPQGQLFDPEPHVDDLIGLFLDDIH